MCFLVNIHNTLFLHSLVHLLDKRIPLETHAQRVAFAKRCNYQIGALTYNLNEIVGVLRGKMKVGTPYQIPKKDLRHKHIISHPEPMLIFAAGHHFFAMHSPPVVPYSLKNFRIRLAQQAATFALQKISVFKNGKISVVMLPHIFSLFLKDFGSAKDALSWVYNLVREKDLLEKTAKVRSEQAEVLPLIEAVLDSKCKDVTIDVAKPFDYSLAFFFDLDDL